MNQSIEFSGGLFKNYHPQNQPKNTYRDAKNIQIESVDGNIMSVTNEKGTTMEVQLGNDIQLSGYVAGFDYRNYTCIGYTQIFDDIIVFLTGINNYDPLNINVTSGSNVLGFNNQFSEIGIVTKNSTGAYYYRRMLNDTDGTRYDESTNQFINMYDQTTVPANFGWGLFNFKICKPIDVVARKLYNGHRIVYFTDDYNKPRSIDLDRTDPYDVNTFESTISLFLDRGITDISNPSVNDSGGSINTGAYLFTSRLLTGNLAASPFGFVSNPIYVTDNNDLTPYVENYDGAPVDTPTNKSITITVENIDVNYSFIDVAVIRFQGQTNTAFSDVFKRVPISGNTMSFTYTGTEDVIEIINEDDITKPAVDYSQAKCIEQKDDILYLSNLKSSNTLDNWQEIANSISLGYTIREIEHGRGTKSNQGLTDYRGTDTHFEFKGYQRNEVYSFAFVPVYKTGTLGQAYHIPGRAITPNISYGSVVNNALAADTSTNELGTFYQETNVYGTDITSTPNYMPSPVQHNNADRVRHHIMPTVSQEPTTAVRNGTVYLRVLGIEILNINISQQFKDKISGYLIVRQQRDDNPNQNKRVIGQGIANRLIKYNVGTMQQIRPIVSNPTSLTMATGTLPQGGYWNTPASTSPPNRNPEGIPGTGAIDFYETSYMFGNMRMNWGHKSAPRHGLRYGESYPGDNNGYDNDKINFYSPDYLLNGVDGTDTSLYEIEKVAQISGTPTVDRLNQSKLALVSSTYLTAAYAIFVTAFLASGGFPTYLVAIIAGWAAFVTFLALGTTKILEAFRLNGICEYPYVFSNGFNGKYRVVGNENLVTVPNVEGGFNKIISSISTEPYWGNENNGGMLIKLNGSLNGPDIGKEEGEFIFDQDSQWNMWGNGNGEGYAKESYVPKNDHDRGLFNALRDLPNQYGDYSQAEYVRCSYIEDINATSGITFFSGDTYIGYFSAVNTSKLRYDLATMVIDKIDAAIITINIPDTNIRFEGVEVPPADRADMGKGGEFRAIMGFFVESTKNVDFRHKVDQGLTYWPVEFDPSQPMFNRDKVYDQSPYLGHTPYYNKIYSKDNSILKFYPPSIIANQSTVENFENRTIYSAQDTTDTVVDNYRLFPIVNYHDIPKNTGPIWDTFVHNKILYLHTLGSLWRTFINEDAAVVGNNDTLVQLGYTGIFSRPSVEMLTINGGYAGTQSQWGNVNTPYGYVFMDFRQRKVFLLSEGLKELSSPALTQYFAELKDYNNHINPVYSDIPYTDKPNYNGYIMGYDFRFHKLLFTSKRWMVYPEVVDFQKSFFTISYNFNTQQWVSFHDYCPDLYMSDGKQLLMIKNPRIQYGTPTNLSRLYSANTGNQGKYLDEITPYNAYIEFVLNDNPLITKIFDSLSMDHFTFSGNNNVVDTFRIINTTTDTQTSGNVNIMQQNLINNPTISANTVIARYIESKYNVTIPRETITKARMRGKYMVVKLIFDNNTNYKIVLNAITAQYRQSFR